ncbi:UPF0764 protein C16orf89 -like protein [Echinococcus granulosus]|uniref:Uncharacterized protein n=1 Tax=Echinococcus granulosus TaxID=6210 RepID=U6JBW1_ECHGR|nr:hypothetical protein EGR_02509 [Echinococcus granulosus]EUB62713.1 hypothetical protein EGR_02509 [Echinococcus granulosus]KAH9281123.1 UPF0764 protein C16orf89 -like protein [Echinococcus granulosus]CDS19229.1 hypothetical protein EgrG_000452100 [Echinococcus granulosus]
MWYRPVLLLACLALAVGASWSRSPIDANLSAHQAEELFAATERALVFMLRNYDALNLDGVLGVRVLQGVYDQLLAACGPDLPRRMAEKMEQLQKLANLVGTLGTVTAAIKTPFYFSRASFLLNAELWRFILPTRHFETLPTTDMNSIFTDDNISEVLSDHCLLEFTQHDSHPQCAISRECFANMNADNHTSYSLTHQILYYLVGIGARCDLQLIDLAGAEPHVESVEQKMAQFCAKIDSEARTLAKNDFPKEARDLFMEQVGMCGVAGFTQIARPEWLDRIVTWQNPHSGCYHRFRGENFDPENFNPLRYGNYRKRSESWMRGGKSAEEACFSHRTAVALIALAAFARRLAEQLVSPLSLPP